MKAWTSCWAPIALLTLMLGASPASRAQDGPSEPLELGVEEQVDVRLVLVDFLVLDRQDRTVPDLTAEDFFLVADGRDVEIASLDEDCPVGAADDPRAGPARRPPPVTAPTAQPRRLVLVFDYYHMTNVAETYDRVFEMLDKWPVGGEEHMVVSLGEVVRIESPLTADLDEVRRTLRRMRNDPDLYAGTYGRLTERRFFDRVRVLFDLLERWPGRKTLVLFSGPFLPDGFYHDPAYRELSALSTAARTAIYPVDTGGLRTLVDPANTRLGGPPHLRRLANETGGRMTADTNEIGLAYARAHRDLGCTYTLGFYDERLRFDDKRRLTIRVKDRGGLRVVYPEFYVVRSREKKQRSLVRTASMAPQMFESEELSADLFVLGPESKRRWRALLAIEIRLDPDEPIESGAEWELKGLVRKPNGTIVHSFERRLPMPAHDPGDRPPSAITVFHELRTRPGRYVVSAVVSNPEAETPRTVTRPVEISRVPRGTPFLIGPILGRRSPSGEEEKPKRRHRSDPEFEPLILAETVQGASLDSLTLVCIAGADEPVDMRTIGRSVTTPGGVEVRRFDPASVELPGKGQVHCHELVDRVPTAELQPGRYRLAAFTETADHVTGRGAAEFTIRPQP